MFACVLSSSSNLCFGAMEEANFIYLIAINKNLCQHTTTAARREARRRAISGLICLRCLKIYLAN